MFLGVGWGFPLLFDFQNSCNEDFQNLLDFQNSGILQENWVQMEEVRFYRKAQHKKQEEWQRLDSQSVIAWWFIRFCNSLLLLTWVLKTYWQVRFRTKSTSAALPSLFEITSTWLPVPFRNSTLFSRAEWTPFRLNKKIWSTCCPAPTAKSCTVWACRETLHYPQNSTVPKNVNLALMSIFKCTPCRPLPGTLHCWRRHTHAKAAWLSWPAKSRCHFIGE